MGWVMMDERELHRIGVLSEIQMCCNRHIPRRFSTGGS